MVPVLPHPDASATASPAPSSNPHAPISPTGAAVVGVVDDVVVVVLGRAVLDVVLELVEVVDVLLVVLVELVLVELVLVLDELVVVRDVVVVELAPGGTSVRHSPSPGRPSYRTGSAPP